MKNIVIVGAGGYASEAAWVLEEMNKASSGALKWQILGYTDKDARTKGREVYGYKILGTSEEIAQQYAGENLWFYCAIGDNLSRAAVTKHLEGLGWQAATLIHPSVIAARKVAIGEGTYIGAGSILCPNSTIGRHVIVNTRVTVGHDSMLADFSQACPGAQINGFCKIGQGAMIGSNSSILPGKSIGDYAVVGANSQVIRSVKAGSTVNGVPAVLIS
jgi:sugar O-acyltransferase (sialic acid O-acetyltransferase NeuD family)